MSTSVTPLTDSKALSLDQLFAEARSYGGVDIFTGREGLYSATITFQTVPGAELIARSGHKLPTPHAALIAAIETAKVIVRQLRDLPA